MVNIIKVSKLALIVSALVGSISCVHAMEDSGPKSRSCRPLPLAVKPVDLTVEVKEESYRPLPLAVKKYRSLPQPQGPANLYQKITEEIILPTIVLSPKQ